MVSESILYRLYVTITKKELILAGIFVGAILLLGIMYTFKSTYIGVPISIIAFTLIFIGPVAKLERTKKFKAKIESLGLQLIDLDKLITFTKSKSSEAIYLPAKVFGVLAALAFPAYNWLLQELLKSYFMATTDGKYIIFLLAIALAVVFLGIFMQNTIERLSINYQYKEITNILEIIRMDCFFKKITLENNSLVKTPS